MAKWEYAEVIVNVDADRGGSTAKAHADVTVFRYDEKHEEKQGPLGKVLGFMGDSGWEMVAAVNAVGGAILKGGRVVYLFKRLKSG